MRLYFPCHVSQGSSAQTWIKLILQITSGATRLIHCVCTQISLSVQFEREQCVVQTGLKKWASHISIFLDRLKVSICLDGCLLLTVVSQRRFDHL